MRLFWACEGWTTSTPSASPPKINLAVLTIMETSTVDLNVSVTHLRLLRLVQDLNRVKIWGEHCSLQTSPQSSRMAGWGWVQCLLANIYFSQLLFGHEVAKCSNFYDFLEQTNQQSHLLSTMSDTVWASVKTTELRGQILTSTLFFFSLFFFFFFFFLNDSFLCRPFPLQKHTNTSASASVQRDSTSL